MTHAVIEGGSEQTRKRCPEHAPEHVDARCGAHLGRINACLDDQGSTGHDEHEGHTLKRSSYEQEQKIRGERSGNARANTQRNCCQDDVLGAEASCEESGRDRHDDTHEREDGHRPRCRRGINGELSHEVCHDGRDLVLRHGHRCCHQEQHDTYAKGAPIRLHLCLCTGNRTNLSPFPFCSHQRHPLLTDPQRRREPAPRPAPRMLRPNRCKA